MGLSEAYFGSHEYHRLMHPPLADKATISLQNLDTSMDEDDPKSAFSLLRTPSMI